MKNNPAIPIALAANSRYLPGLLATMASLLMSARDRQRLVFHILSDGLTDREKADVRDLARQHGLKEEIDFIETDMREIREKFGPFKDSWTAYLRIFLPELLPGTDWVLYADVDTLWFKDVCELWEERDDRYSVCWCHDMESTSVAAAHYSREWNPDFDVSRYACSGVALMNLNWMRENRIIARSIEFVRKWGTPYLADQDILNTFFMKSSKLVDRTWDMTGAVQGAEKGVVIHFNGIGTRWQHPFNGYHPFYAIWYRFYTDVILRKPHAQFASPLLRCFWWCVGLINPLSKPVSLVLSVLTRIELRDRIARQVFSAYLMRKAVWWRFWLDKQAF